MLVSVLNYLNNGSFIKNVDLQNLQNCVEAARQIESLFQDGDQKVNADSDPYLGFDCIGRCPVKGFDSQMLLYPAEKEFHLPSLLVNIGDGFCRNGKYIGQIDPTSLYEMEEKNSPLNKGGILSGSLSGTILRNT